jgi:hypothetical protein
MDRAHGALLRCRAHTATAASTANATSSGTFIAPPPPPLPPLAPLLPALPLLPLVLLAGVRVTCALAERVLSWAETAVTVTMGDDGRLAGAL